MPPLPPVPNVAKVTVKGHFAGQPWANVFHVVYPGVSMTVAQATDLANLFHTEFKNQILNQMSSSMTLDAIDVQDLGSTSGVSTELLITPPDQGSVAAQQLPSSAAIVIGWTIASRYKGGHPRTYITGLTTGHLEAVDAPNVVRGTVANALQVGANHLRLGVGAIGSGWGLVCVAYRRHRVLLGPTTTPPGPIVNPITVGTVRPHVHSQRRRLGKAA